MIYTLTLNPALDYVLAVDTLTWGGTNRARAGRIYFGGKGINVATVLGQLGLESVCLGLIAGFTGDALEQALRRRGMATDFVRLPQGDTRINVKLKGEAETELNAPGPAVTAEDMEALYQKLEQLNSGDTLVLSGSLPPSLPKTVYADILARWSGRGVRFVVDAAGELLTNTLPYRPFLIKPNRAELEELCGHELDSDDALAQAAQDLQNQGARNVLVSLGPDGALLLDEGGQLHRRAAHPGVAVNTVGAGDAMVAGFLAGADRGPDYALDLAVAAGCATAFSPDLATAPEIQALFPG